MLAMRTDGDNDGGGEICLTFHLQISLWEVGCCIQQSTGQGALL